MTLLTSTQNPRVKGVINLWDKRERDKTNKFIIEGYREISRALNGKHAFDSLFFCQELFLGINENAIIAQMRNLNVPVFSCSEQVFRKMSYRDRPDGLIAIAPQQHLKLDWLQHKKFTKPPFLLVVESIEKPGNLGTILRSADAVGIDALIVCDACTDIHNPNVVRASVGTLFSVPLIEATSQGALDWLKKNNIMILAATPSAKHEFTQVDLAGPLAIAVGSEQLGLTKLWMENANIQVKIPMCGVADSLNVAMATTLLLYETLRQRRGQ